MQMSAVSSPVAAPGSVAERPRMDPRLASAAHEFEASLLQELLKPLQHNPLSASIDHDDSEDGGGSDAALMSFGSEAMAKGLSEHGGLGIARTILHQLSQTQQHGAVGNSKETK